VTADPPVPEGSPPPSPDPSPDPRPDPQPGEGAPAPTKAEGGKAEGGRAEGDGDRKEQEGKRSALIAQVVGSVSFLGALLVYMGWNFDSNVLSQFSVPSPTSVGLSTAGLALSGLTPLFESNAAFFGAALVACIILVAKAVDALPKTGRDKIAGMGRSTRRLLLLGLLLTILTLAVTWPNVSSGAFRGWFGGHVYGVYLALALLAAGQLLIAWPTRQTVSGQFVYPLALVVVALLALWAGGVYAATLGFQSALGIQDDVYGLTAVTVYSAEPLGLSGPGVACSRVQPGPGYPYECTGLRLLLVESGTYYLLPKGWTYGDHTYILDDSDQIRIELSPGCTPKSPARQC
jgi:hypothetical protein